jgi:hypothetical protein
MAARKMYHVVPAQKGIGWDIKSSRRVVGHADTREEAVDAAIRAAKQHPLACVKARLRDGTCEEDRLFGEEPR